MSASIANFETLAEFSEADFRKRYPDTAFPETIENHNVGELGFAVVEAADAPALSAGETVEPGELLRKGDRVFREWKIIHASEQELASMFEQAVQASLDGAAKVRGYDSISTAISYAEEPAVPKFQNDGRAFRTWRSLVWAYAYEQLAAVKAGEREQPSLDGFLAELPALDLPA